MGAAVQEDCLEAEDGAVPEIRYTGLLDGMTLPRIVD
jgi:hypothetical protein